MVRLLTAVTIQGGLRSLGKTPPCMRDNLVARVRTPILEDGTDLWDTFLNCRDVNFHGHKNADKYYRFRTEHLFDIRRISNAELVNGAILYTRDAYLASKGTEFIILDYNHAIRADKYARIRDRLIQGGYSVGALEDGIFIINEEMSPEHVIKYDRSIRPKELRWGDIVYVHYGWLEHAVGKNRASRKEYLEAAKLLANYVLQAEKKGCFKKEGMGYYVNTSDVFVVRPWCLYYSKMFSSADAREGFHLGGRFLGAQHAVATIVEPEFLEGYQGMVKGDPVLNTPHGSYVLAKGLVKEEQ